MSQYSGTWLGYLFVGLFAVVGVLLLAAMVYAVASRRFTDKIVAANLVGSLVLNLILLLAVYLAEDYILDVGLVFAMLSFLGVVVLCRVVTDHILGKMRHLQYQDPTVTKGRLAQEGMDEPGRLAQRRARRKAAAGATPDQKEGK